MDKDNFGEAFIKTIVSLNVATLLADIEGKLKEDGIEVEINVKNVDFNKIMARAKEIDDAKAKENENNVNIFSAELDEFWKRRNE